MRDNTYPCTALRRHVFISPRWNSKENKSLTKDFRSVNVVTVRLANPGGPLYIRWCTIFFSFPIQLTRSEYTGKEGEAEKAERSRSVSRCPDLSFPLSLRCYYTHIYIYVYLLHFFFFFPFDVSLRPFSHFASHHFGSFLKETDECIRNHAFILLSIPLAWAPPGSRSTGHV